MNDYSKSIGAKVSNEEFDQIMAAANQMGLSKSEFVRKAVNDLLANPMNPDEKDSPINEDINLQDENLDNNPSLHDSEASLQMPQFKINCCQRMNFTNHIVSCLAISIITCVIYEYITKNDK
jgi:hypothetical protein